MCGGGRESGRRDAVSAALLVGLLENDSFERNWAMELGNAVIVDGLARLALDPAGASAAAVYDRAIGVRLLDEDGDSGEEHSLIRYPGGEQWTSTPSDC